MNPVHVITVCDYLISNCELLILERKSYIEQTKHDHENSLWFKWFGFKYNESKFDWDYGCMYASYAKFRITEYVEIKQMASYHLKHGKTWIEVKDKHYVRNFGKKFYAYCDENKIPY